MTVPMLSNNSNSPLLKVSSLSDVDIQHYFETKVTAPCGEINTKTIEVSWFLYGENVICSNFGKAGASTKISVTSIITLVNGAMNLGQIASNNMM